MTLIVQKKKYSDQKTGNFFPQTLLIKRENVASLDHDASNEIVNLLVIIFCVFHIIRRRNFRRVPVVFRL